MQSDFEKLADHTNDICENLIDICEVVHKKADKIRNVDGENLESSFLFSIAVSLAVNVLSARFGSGTGYLRPDATMYLARKVLETAGGEIIDVGEQVTLQ